MPESPLASSPDHITQAPIKRPPHVEITWPQAGLLTLILLLSLFLRTWNLSKEGSGNAYYFAAVKSMLHSPSNFFFGAFDPLGIVTVDKPPMSLWLQGFSAWIFGFSTVSVMLPQALLGVFNVYLTFLIIRQGWSARSALIAAFAVSIMPIAVAMDRLNMPDTLLLTTTLLSAHYLLKSCRSGSVLELAASLAFLGFGFTTKMLAAWVVLPAWFIVWWKATPVTGSKKFGQTAIAGIVLLATSLAWAVAFDLTPPDKRPYAGGSNQNSMMQLTVGYNGLSRIFGRMGGGPPGGRPPGAGPDRKDSTKKDFQTKPDRKNAQPKGEDFAGGPPPMGGGGPPGMGRGGPMAFFSAGPIGPWRLIWPSMAGLAFWLTPFALLGLPNWRMIKLPNLDKAQAIHALFAGWFIMWALVMCFSGGIMHPYYSIMISPAMAALAGISMDRILTDGFPQGRRGKQFLGFAVIWQMISIAYSPEWRLWLIPSISLLILLPYFYSQKSEPGTDRHRRLLYLTLSGFFIAPFFWSLTPTFGQYAGFMPAADPSFIYNRNKAPATLPGASLSYDNRQRLYIYLKKHQPGSKILMAMSAAPEAAPFIINFDDNIIAVGGFHGHDPIFTESDLLEMVKKGELKYAMSSPRGRGGRGRPGGGGGPGGGPPGMPGNNALSKIIETHGTLVDPKAWFIADPKPPVIDPDMPDFMREMMSQPPALYSLGSEPVAKKADAPAANPIEPKS